MKYNQFSCFCLKNDICLADIEKRNVTYRTNPLREELKTKYANHTDYVRALNMRVDIHEAQPSEYSRIAELTQRTNRCTNGKRYTVAEIKERIASDLIKLYSVSVTDRFSDLGLVGAMEVEGESLTLFSLSCRALGREIENKMLEYIRRYHFIDDIKFISTGKNESLISILSQFFRIL